MKCRLTLLYLDAAAVQHAGPVIALRALVTAADLPSVVHLERQSLEDVVDSVTQMYHQAVEMVVEAAGEASLTWKSAVARRLEYCWQVWSPSYREVMFVEYVASD